MYIKTAEYWWDYTEGKKNRNCEIETCPKVTFSATNHTWKSPGSNTDLYQKTLATKRLSHARPFVTIILI